MQLKTACFEVTKNREICINKKIVQTAESNFIMI